MHLGLTVECIASGLRLSVFDLGLTAPWISTSLVMVPSLLRNVSGAGWAMVSGVVVCVCDDEASRQRIGDQCLCATSARAVCETTVI